MAPPHSSDLLESALKLSLKSAGYRKKARVWHKTTNDVITVLDIQRSQWGGNVIYVNVGIALSDLCSSDRPPTYKCQITMREPDITDVNVDWRIYDPLKDEVVVHAEVNKLAARIEKIVLPFLDGLSTRDGIKEFLGTDLSSRVGVSLSLKQALGLLD